nr:ribonuclease H-like domain-containing protein [Tanacetum cinerariifolium]
MLADSKLPTMFWTEAVRTACYVLNRVSVTRPHNTTPYALLTRNIPPVSYFKPFGCHVTILNTSDHLGKFDGKADKGYIVGYSASNKAYKELVRLKGQAQRATSDAKSLGLGFANDAEEFQTQASAKTVPPGCIPVPTGNFPVPTGSIPVPTGNTVVSTYDVPVLTSSSTDSFFDDKPITRFPSSSDLGNHDPSHVFSLLHPMMMMLFLRYGSTTLRDKVIVTLSNLNVTMMLMENMDAQGQIVFTSRAW